MKRLLLISSIAFSSAATVAAADVGDTLVPNLNYSTQGVKDVYYAKNNPAKTILHHIQAFASQEPEELVVDYKNNSTLTFGPYGMSSGNTYEAKGREEIQGTFQSFFAGGLPPFTVMTITSASRIGNQFYQTFELRNDALELVCIGSDTFQVTGNTIIKQTAFVANCD